MGITFDLGQRRRRARRAAKVNAEATGPVRTELDHIIAAARLVVSTRFATATLLVSRLGVSEEGAARILSRLVHCEIIGPVQKSGRHSVVATSAELPGIIREFERRG
jgi:hypothetical protein